MNAERIVEAADTTTSKAVIADVAAGRELSGPLVAESSTWRSCAKCRCSTCVDTRRSRRHRCTEFRTGRIRYVSSLKSPHPCLAGGSRLLPRRSNGRPDLKRGRTWKGPFQAAEGRSTGSPGSPASGAGLPKSGVIWQDRKISSKLWKGIRWIAWKRCRPF
jgi:hypothetical protein